MNPSNSPEHLSNSVGNALTPGQMLRAARESKGMHLALLSVTMKVPTRQLEALENDQYEAFSGVAFVRAVALAMCRHLGMDPAPVLAGLPQTASAWMPTTPSVTESVARTQWPSPGAGRAFALSRSVWIAAGLMLAASAALIWWPAKAPLLGPSETLQKSELQAPMVSPAETVQVTPGAPAVVTASPETAAPAVMVPVVSVPAAAPAPSVASNALVSAPASSSSFRSGTLIAATGETWLEVRDAKGVLVINRLLKAGDSQPVDVSAPFSVVLGHAQMAKVTVGGKDFDLTPFTKLTVARFDIQP